MIDETNITTVDETTENTQIQNGPKKPLVNCTKCYKKIEYGTKICPHCGKKQTSTKSILIAGGAVVAGICIFGAVNDSKKENDDSSQLDRAIIAEVTATENTTESATTTILQNTTVAITALQTTEAIITTAQAETKPPSETERKLLTFYKSDDSNFVHIDIGCGAVSNILPENLEKIEIYEDELEQYKGVYQACGRCSRYYREKLPPIE